MAMGILNESTPASRSDNDLILQMLAENQQLLKINHELLLKQERRAKVGLITKLVWYGVLLFLPLILYYFLYNTLMDAMSFGNGTEGNMSATVDTLQQLIDAYNIR